MRIAVALGGPRRQAMLLYLFQRERISLNGGCGAVIALAKPIHAGSDNFRDQSPGRIMVAKLIDETLLVSLGSAINVPETAVQLRQRRHALGDDNGHVVVAGGIVDDASQRFFLDLDFDVAVALA